MADESDFERGYAKGFKAGFEAGTQPNQQAAVSPPQFSSLYCEKCGRNLNVPGGVVCSMAVANSLNATARPIDIGEPEPTA